LQFLGRNGSCVRDAPKRRGSKQIPEIGVIRTGRRRRACEPGVTGRVVTVAGLVRLSKKEKSPASLLGS
jgi:hypothetical protein